MYCALDLEKSETRRCMEKGGKRILGGSGGGRSWMVDWYCRHFGAAKYCRSETLMTRRRFRCRNAECWRSWRHEIRSRNSTRRVEIGWWGNEFWRGFYLHKKSLTQDDTNTTELCLAEVKLFARTWYRMNHIYIVQVIYARLPKTLSYPVRVNL